MVDLNMNWIAIIVATLVPSIVGFIYYNLIFKNAWLSSLGRTEEEMEPNNPAVTYGLGFVTAFIIANALNFTIQLTHKDINDKGELFVNSNFWFGHGALHGAMMALTLVVPVIISLGMFQKAGGKNIALNCLFWVICLAIMGGIVDAWQ